MIQEPSSEFTEDELKIVQDVSDILNNRFITINTNAVCLVGDVIKDLAGWAYVVVEVFSDHSKVKLRRL
jgi:hypothetical protein